MRAARWDIYKITEYAPDGSVKKTKKIGDIWVDMMPIKTPEDREKIAKENGGDILAATADEKTK